MTAEADARTLSKPPPRGPVVVLGASNLIAGCLPPRLAAAGIGIIACGVGVLAVGQG